MKEKTKFKFEVSGELEHFCEDVDMVEFELETRMMNHIPTSALKLKISTVRVDRI